ncbi:MAG: TolC family protein, partial [Acidobacteria bacterium]|nr:TolC family protein [Acidobacteriota bacterium]
VAVAGACAAAQEAARAPLALSLRRAIELALAPEGNARVQLAGEAVRAAEARSAESRAALLPDVSATAAVQNFTRNLEAFGIRLRQGPPGFEFPTVVGPLTVYDARAALSQSIFDFSLIRRYQASRAVVRAARSELGSTEEEVAAAVARAYLAAQRAEADVEARRANIELAEALLRQAENQKTAGTGTGIEVTRARVQLASERQRLIGAENELRRARRELLRALGLRLNTALELADKLTYTPVEDATLAGARAEALRNRSDLKAQQEREQSARLAADAAGWERLPSVAGFADYGSIGADIGRLLPTRVYGLAVRVPVFDGGRRQARRAESQAQYRQERIRTRDLREQVDLEVELALDGLRSAAELVGVSEEGLKLAEAELAQARRRYEAGVAPGLEVTDAQTRLERARDNRIAALFQHQQARIDLGRASGSIRRMLP